MDHATQLNLLQSLPEQEAIVRVTGCLGNCERSTNIVVVSSPAGRRRGGQVMWFGHMLTPELTCALAAWIAAGGLGIAALPALLSAHQVDPPRRQAPARVLAAARGS